MSAAPKFPPDFTALVRRAQRAARHAYAPHSGYHVGAAAVAAEGATMRLARIAIFVASAVAFPPCGACRQVIAEFAGPDVAVVYFGQRGAPISTTIGELLPRAFRL